jgi:hypothetical protein
MIQFCNFEMFKIESLPSLCSAKIAFGGGGKMIGNCELEI